MLEDEFPQVAGKKIIFYAPTYRGHIAHAHAPHALDVRGLAQRLSNDYVLLTKYHAYGVKTRPALPTDQVASYTESLAAGFDPAQVKAFKAEHVDMCDGHAIERTIALIES